MNIDYSPQEKLRIYQDLFRGRDDVFAVRWENKDRTKKGYTPICVNEWKAGICLKLNRSRCKDCKDKKYTQLNDYYLTQHLKGIKTFGIYPLLSDNTSYFIAVDFDKKNWKKDIKNLAKLCNKYQLPVYFERSRSGNGAHAWFFFENNYPAEKSRSIILKLLEKAKIIDGLSMLGSYDRIFPNQDYLTGKEIGNLIVLPLQGQSRQQDNTIFIDPKNQKPIANQWEYLANVEKISNQTLDNLYKLLNKIEKKSKIKYKDILPIAINEQIILPKDNLPPVFTSFLREHLNLANLEYLIKKRAGLGIYNIERYFNLIESDNENIKIPRGFLNQLISFLDKNEIKYQIIDKRNKFKPVKVRSNLKLKPYQQDAIKNLLLSENGILVAPPASGKTIIGIELIVKLKQPALIITHKKQIFSQWTERIESFLSIPKRKIGQICSNKKKIGNIITVAMVQTLNKSNISDKLKDKIGLVIVDECHHMPAKMFRNVITKINPYYLYGLTATPDRKYKDEKLIFIYLGDILHIITEENLKETKSQSKNKKLGIIIRETNLDLPFEARMGNTDFWSKTLIYDSIRNKLIAEDIKAEVNQGSKCLILTERKEHAEILNQYLNSELETIVLTGNLTQKQRKEKIKQIETGNFQVLIATGQLLGEGTDFKNLNSLFLVYPFSFHGKLIQYIGRITRDLNPKIPNKVYDYRDNKIEYLEKWFKNREKYYKEKFELNNKPDTYRLI